MNNLTGSQPPINGYHGEQFPPPKEPRPILDSVYYSPITWSYAPPTHEVLTYEKLNSKGEVQTKILSPIVYCIRRIASWMTAGVIDSPERFCARQTAQAAIESAYGKDAFLSFQPVDASPRHARIGDLFSRLFAPYHAKNKYEVGYLSEDALRYASEGNFLKLKRNLEAGADINYKNNEQENMAEMVMHGAIDLIPDRTEAYGKRMQQYIQCMQYLMDKGMTVPAHLYEKCFLKTSSANPATGENEIKPSLDEATTPEFQRLRAMFRLRPEESRISTALTEASDAMLKAAEKGDLKAIEEAVNNGADICCCDELGRGVLDYLIPTAYRVNHKRKLVEVGYMISNMTSEEENLYATCVRSLTDKGAKFNREDAVLSGCIAELPEAIKEALPKD